MLKSVKFYVFSKSMHKVCIFKNKKDFQFPESLVILVIATGFEPVTVCLEVILHFVLKKLIINNLQLP